MKGILLVNHFYQSQGLSALCGRLEEEAAALGVVLERRTAAAFLTPLGAPLAPDFDFVLFWDKDILLARRFEAAGLPVFNTADAIALCDDKGASALAFEKQGLAMPQTLLAPFTYSPVGYTDTDFVKTAVAALGLPVVIKELFGSFGAQVYLARSVKEAEATVQAISPRPFLMQEFIAASFGRDIRVNVVGERVIAAMERRGREGDFRSNIAAGGSGTPVRLSPEAEALALGAVKAVGADFAGVDLLLGEGGTPLLCEINSNPHFIGSERYCGANIAKEIIAHIIQKVRKTL